MNMITAMILAATLCSDPPLYIVSEKVDLIEVNHYFDSKGNAVLEQAIYYEWSAENARFDVMDYKLLKTASQSPRCDPPGDYFSLWHDGNVLRNVQSHSFIETWTQYDPEHRERELLSHENRQGLAAPPVKADARK